MIYLIDKNNDFYLNSGSGFPWKIQRSVAVELTINGEWFWDSIRTFGLSKLIFN